MNNKDNHIHDDQDIKQKKEFEQIQENKINEPSIEIEPLINSHEKKIIDPQIIQLENKLTELKKNNHEVILRAKAEIENMRRRNEQDIEKIYKFSLERFINELLPVIDNLEKAIELVDKKNTSLSSMLEGLELTLKSFLDTIKKYGIEIIEETNVIFNPEFHQAIKIIESDKYLPNYIINILQKGYILNGRLLRPAMVIVSNKK